MAKIIINREKCKGCFLCVSVCPRKLIEKDSTLNKRGARPVKFSRQNNKIAGGTPQPAGSDNNECLGCALCAIVCPDCCIEVYK